MTFVSLLQVSETSVKYSIRVPSTILLRDMTTVLEFLLLYKDRQSDENTNFSSLCTLGTVEP